MELTALKAPPMHTKPKWKVSEWFGSCQLEYVKTYFHHVGNYIGVHSNEFFELNIVVEGSGWYYINDRFYDIIPGSIIIVPPGIPHGCTTESTLNVFHALIKCSFFEQYEYELLNLPGYTILFEIEPYLRNESREPFCIRSYREDFDDIVSLLHNLVKLEQNPYPGREVLKNSLFLYLVGVLSASASNMKKYQKYNTTDQISMSIVCIMEYIRMNAGKKINIDDLAKKCKMSRSTFFRYFNKVCGCTPIAFLNLCRISLAKRLLCHTNKSISDIAQDCGFFDSSHFIRTFTSNEGITPSDFRNLYSGSTAYSLCSLCARRT